MVASQYFQEILDSSSKLSNLSLPALKPTFLKFEFSKDDVSETVYSSAKPVLPFACSDVVDAKIASWRKLSSCDSECKPIYEVTFDVEGSNLNFKPGDTIGVIAQNNTKEVDIVLQHLDIATQSDRQYTLTVDTTQKGSKIPPHIPVKSTLRHLFTYCVDLRSVVKKLFLLALAEHTKEENERKIIEYLCSKEGSSDYTEYVLNKGVCILDIFNMFKSCKPPVEVLLNHLPRLLPRPYSIVNSNTKYPNIIKVCFSVMELANNRKGLVTSYLEDVLVKELSLENGMENLSLNEKNKIIPIYLRKNMNGFTMPEVKIPLILIGPGTGVAPFIGFLEEREILKERDSNIQLGETWLYFGCRNPKLDYIYEKELNGFLEKEILNKLSTAFSRVDNEIKYVQDAILKDGKEIVKLLEQGAAIFICGDQKNMAAQVKESLVQCLSTHGSRTEVQSRDFISNMEKEKRYFVDLWS